VKVSRNARAGAGRSARAALLELDKPDLGFVSLCIIQSSERDPMVEFVVEQLKRVRWISGHSFVGNGGYHLEWSSEGSHRMMLLERRGRELVQASEAIKRAEARLAAETPSVPKRRGG